MKEIQPIQAQLEQLQVFLTYKDKSNPKISVAGVGWHIEHSLVVLDQIMDALISSDPSEYQYQFNLWKTIIFWRGQIPRGKAKAPKSVRVEHPSNSDEALLNLVQKVNQKLSTIINLPKNSFFVHPIFGKMNLKESIRMMYLHTKHHLFIIQDVIIK